MAVWVLFGMLLAGDEVLLRSETIKRVVEEFIRQSYDDSSEEVVLEFLNIPEVKFPVSDSYELRIAPTGTSPLRGTLLVPVEVIAGSNVSHRFLVSVRVRTFGNVFVAKTQIPKNAPIREEDLQQRRMETTSLPLDRMTSAAEVVGQRAKRIITPGSILCRSMLELQPTIQRGQVINLLVKTGTVMIVTKAVAREDGYAGRVIEVQRKDSRERLKARVEDAHTARIEFD